MCLKELLIVADDFGMDEYINNSIIELAKSRYINATSVMLNASLNMDSFRRVKDCNIIIGLHFCITFGTALSSKCSQYLVDKEQRFFTPGRQFKNIYLPNEKFKKALTDELDTQISEFYEIFGRPPAFIDSHHHIHEFSFLRDLVVRKAKELNLLVRSTTFTFIPHSSWKNSLIYLFLHHAGKKTWRQCLVHGVRTNDGYFSILTYDQAPCNYSELWIKGLCNFNGHLMILAVHPGAFKNEMGGQDRYTQGRYHEFISLKNEELMNFISSNYVMKEFL